MYRFVPPICLAIFANSFAATANSIWSPLPSTDTIESQSGDTVEFAPLLNAGENKITIIGELHGTTEIPRFFGRLVGAAAETGGQVLVGLELPADIQPALDEFLSSDGGTLAREAFLSGGRYFWMDREAQDGRSSRAMFGLVDSLRSLQIKTQRLRVIAFDTQSSAVAPGYLGPDEDAPGWGDRTMAETVRRAWADGSFDRGYILVGNIHAMRAQGNRVYPLMAMHLPANQVISLDASYAGGSAWVCNVNGCGIQSLGKAVISRLDPVIVLDPPSDLYDGEVRFGSISASPPWAGQDEAAQ